MDTVFITYSYLRFVRAGLDFLFESPFFRCIKLSLRVFVFNYINKHSRLERSWQLEFGIPLILT